MASEKIKILGAVLELPAKQHCQSSPFTSKLDQIGQIFEAKAKFYLNFTHIEKYLQFKFSPGLTSIFKSGLLISPSQICILSNALSFYSRVRPRCFDQVGHQTTSASIGNRYFFTKLYHHQAYQNYEQRRQKLGTFLVNKVL